MKTAERMYWGLVATLFVTLTLMVGHAIYLAWSWGL